MDKEYKVTLLVHSGLPNPVWWVKPDHEKFKELKKLHSDARATGNTHRHEHIPAILGYKGFLLHHPDSERAELILGRETTSLQKLLFGTMPREAIHHTLHQTLSKAIDSGAVSAIRARPAPTVGQGAIQHYAPEYNPDRWNEYDIIRENNNCYNYANQKITNTFAQPGRASGHPISPFITPENTLTSAESDGLVKMDVPSTAPVPKAPEQPNCLVALVVAQYVDFHWYRLDNTGFWSHKPGSTPVTDVDGAGNKITDPRQAANSPYGPNYQFVSFMKIFTNIIE